MKDFKKISPLCELFASEDPNARSSHMRNGEAAQFTVRFEEEVERADVAMRVDHHRLGFVRQALVGVLQAGIYPSAQPQNG